MVAAMELELKALLRIVVVSLLVAWTANYVYATKRRRQHDREFAKAHGCKPIKSTLINRWPLGLDLLKKQYTAFNENRLFTAQANFLAPYEATVALWLFGQEGIFTTDHKNIEYVNATRFEDYGLGSRRDGCLPFLGEGIFCQDGPAWKHSREVLRRQFTRLNYNDLTTFESSVDAFIATFASSKGVVDIHPACFQFTLSTTTALLFGEPIDDLGTDMTKEFADNFDYASEKTALRIRLADLCFLYNPSSFKASCNVVRKFANHFVQKALQCQANYGEKEAFERYPFIIDMYKESHDPKVVCDQLINVLLAGRDTTACTMSWAIFMLVRHPEKLARLREEIFAATGGKTKFTRAHLLAMPYLKAVINETLRLYPQIPVNVRIALNTTYLPRGGGPDGKDPILIKKGQGVGFSTYHMHRSKEVFGEDATHFRPERWLTGELADIGSGFLPFHSGPRICLGKDFAFTEASFAIGRFVQAFPNLRLPDGVEAVPVGLEPQSLTIVVSSADGCKVMLD